MALYARYASQQSALTAEGRTVYETNTVEYPPLALAPILLAGAVASHGIDVSREPEAYLARYKAVFRGELAIIDLLSLLILCNLIDACHPRESVKSRVARALVYVFGGLALGSIIHTRLDLVLGFLIVAALWLLVRRANWLYSFGILAAAACFKLVPIVLLPVWIVASLSVDRRGPWLSLRKIRDLMLTWGGRVAAFVLLTAAWLLPFYLLAGQRAFAFLGYHRERGIEIESWYSTVIFLIGGLGGNVKVYFSHGSYNVQNEWTSMLAQLAMCILVVGYISAALLLVFRGQRIAVRPRQLAAPDPRVYSDYVGDVVNLTAMFLLYFVVFNKVLSPQYVLWLLPLVPLLQLDGSRRFIYLALFLASCVLTSVITPLLWDSHILGRHWLEGGGSVLGGPTLLGTIVLTIRNGLLLVLLLWLMHWFIRRISCNQSAILAPT